MLVIGGSLAWGMWGYRYFEHLRWLDAFLNAAMLLGGMGPVENPQTEGGKLFAGIYALYAGMVVSSLPASSSRRCSIASSTGSTWNKRKEKRR